MAPVLQRSCKYTLLMPSRNARDGLDLNFEAPGGVRVGLGVIPWDSWKRSNGTLEAVEA
jgi:hypothetical protein